MRDPNRPLLPLTQISLALILAILVIVFVPTIKKWTEQWPTSATTSSTQSHDSRSVQTHSEASQSSLPPALAEESSSEKQKSSTGESSSRTKTEIRTLVALNDDPLPNISIPFRFSPGAFPKAPPSDAEFEWNARAMTFEFYLNNAKVPTLKKTHKLTGKLSDVCWQVTIAKPDLPLTMRVRAVIANTQGKAFETGAARVGYPKETNVNVGVKVNPCALSDWEETNVQRIVSEWKRRAVRQ